MAKEFHYPVDEVKGWPMPKVVSHFLAVQQYYKVHYEIQARMMGAKISKGTTEKPAPVETPRTSAGHKFQFKALS